jgi:hypothetical protein
MWNVIITLTSVGYGDIYPKSFMGRILGIIISFWGVFIVSYFVVTVSETFQLDPSEAQAYDLIMALYNKGLLKKRAVEVLSSAYLLRNVRQAAVVDDDLLLAAMRSFRSEILKFKKQVAQVKNIHDARHDIGSEIMLAKNECFKHLFKIQDQQESMVDFNLKYIYAYIKEMKDSTILPQLNDINKANSWD